MVAYCLFFLYTPIKQCHESPLESILVLYRFLYKKKIIGKLIFISEYISKQNRKCRFAVLKPEAEQFSFNYITKTSNTSVTREKPKGKYKLPVFYLTISNVVCK